MARTILLLFTAACLFAQDPAGAKELVNQGVQAFKAAKYAEAAGLFQKAVDSEPTWPTPHLYLGTALMSQYIPGAATPENSDFARRAEAEFVRVLDLEPNNKVALASLASLVYNEAQGASTPEAKLAKLDEAAGWYRKLAEVEPGGKEAYYSLGVIAWAKFYPALMQARAKLGMKPEDPGPLRDPAARADLLSRYGATVDEGISNLKRALEIDPRYDDAMAYVNLLVRERADLDDSQEAYRRDVQEADEWVSKALETKKEKAQGVVGSIPSVAPPAPQSGGGAPERIRVGAAVQTAKLVRKIDPEYPALAKQARIQGTVRFNVVIAKDGTVRDTQLVSGHPLLVPPALDALKQWVYKPTLLNGEPVEVVTQVDINFTLP